MAHKKAGGSTTNLRDSQGQRLGVKLYSGEKAKSGMVIIRQRGTAFRAGANTRRAKDDTIFATAAGTVAFKKKMHRGYDGKLKNRTEVSIA